MARRGVRLVFVFILCAVIMSFVGMGVAYLLLTAEPSVAGGSTLVLRVGAIPERTVSDPLTNLLIERRQLSLTEVIQGLRKARTDPRIDNVLLVPAGLPQDYWGRIQEVREAVLDYRTSGKPAYAYLEYGGEREYYLATAADRIFLMPTSPLDLTGIASYSVFLRGLFDKVGAVADLHHVGEYKTAPNQYTETTFTDSHREMAEAINQSYFDQLVHDTAEGRDKTDAQITALIDEGPFLAEAALEAGLVDQLAYADEVEAFIAGEGESFTSTDGLAYAATSPSSAGIRTGARMGVVYVTGTIASGQGGFDPLYGSITGSDGVLRQIRRLRNDDSLKAVIVRVDSPGGSTIASDVIWRELQRVRDDDPDRPIVVSMSDLAASGGYYVSMPAHAIVAQPGTLTGSIGIYGGKILVGGVYEKLGMNIESLSQGRFADMNSPVRRYDEGEQAKLQEQLDDFYHQFVQKVADSRGMSWDEVNALAQGRVWTGRQAKDLGLVDELGGLAEAVKVAKQRAGIDEDVNVELVAYLPQPSVFDLLIGQLARVQTGALGGWAPALARLVAAPLAAALTPPASARSLLGSVSGEVFRRGELLALAPFMPWP